MELYSYHLLVELSYFHRILVVTQSPFTGVVESTNQRRQHKDS